MSSYQITHTRPDGTDADRRIDGFLIGGQYYTIDQVIDWIRKGLHSFFVLVWGRRVEVIVKQHPLSGRWYLTTVGDGYPPNNLLNLPAC